MDSDSAHGGAFAAVGASEQQPLVSDLAIQYLNERKEFENGFLQALARSPIPATVAWGIHDTAAPVRVADYVWKHELESRKAPANFWLMPCGNHYVQPDQPAKLARIVRLELTGKLPAAPENLSSGPCSPVLAAHHE